MRSTCIDISSNLLNEKSSLFGILKYVCYIVVKGSRSLSHLLMGSCCLWDKVAVCDMYSCIRKLRRAIKLRNKIGAIKLQV